jgi:deoxycytidylate deaminase
MDGGNDLRKKTTRDVMARLAITRIRVARERDDDEESENQPRPRTAYILNSLKRPEEVTKLREIYGGAFFLVSAYASRERRRDALAARIAKSKNLEMRECIWRAEKLIERDEIESRVAAGQDVRDTFPLADAFLNADDKAAIEASVRRTVRILFGHPFETPTIDEMGMQYAYSAALRSSDLSRQVGYAACTDDGQVLAVGTNEVAKPGGGFYWPDSPDDARDFRVVESDEPNAEMKLAILKDLLEHLNPHGYLTVTADITDELVSTIAKQLKGSRFMAITEYGRAVHAEMGVITDAARRGVALQSSTLYGRRFRVTTAQSTSSPRARSGSSTSSRTRRVRSRGSSATRSRSRVPPPGRCSSSRSSASRPRAFETSSRCQAEKTTMALSSPGMRSSGPPFPTSKAIPGPISEANELPSRNSARLWQTKV